MHYTDSINIKEQNQISTKQRPIRILHVVGGMNRGGVETWLMHVLRNIDRDRFQMDFLVHTTEPCPYDDEAIALGSKIIPCLSPAKPWLYARNFKRILREYGPYDVVHSHVHHFSGYVLWLAKQADIAVRIAHSHNDTSSAEAKARLYRRLYLNLSKWLIARSATLSFGCSRNAVADLFQLFGEKDQRWQILYYGIDLTPFREPVDAITIRAELGIPADAFVIGHIGRFAAQKNHSFLLKIAAEVAKKEPKMRLLLLGEGSLRPEIEQKAMELELGDRLIFTSNRSDVPRLMLGAMDAFILPSLYEGLPVVGIEAQAAGLPFILSDVITEEVDIVKPLIQRISLLKSASVWADAVLSARNTRSNIAQADSLAILENSPFNIAFSVNKITKTYKDGYC
ncbi:MAG: glycosyltransferase family 1 protein [Oscillatoriales cyanobacterium]|uniref:Glycosyltransferase family 1 protein n=1 Tax=Microcoleus anatoxicus PTRS2 TaxID=2705321 RepID=A0ABU8YG31_9CYAN|nr:MAG: glycosyltransferase family 1 protein [Oscillatoriales cyanobacterium]TAD95834.1 MAG: glycosyltransferase family 1 protein [Oscillatoriales cyanobacterium]TAE03471.1 MAG: glycosyltransferase family 1 protein [Oscillatoriales cyanobacterium]TAF04066.1 MAG: glycosyltransferase family 1 protein [Oscillatoriales cyanobacterium]TAF48018.1 MAG: glycosyltransferase family 1 protein [Oscillatoriales cyanobacterium]